MNFIIDKHKPMQKWVIYCPCKVCGKKFGYHEQEEALCPEHYEQWIRKQKLIKIKENEFNN